MQLSAWMMDQLFILGPHMWGPQFNNPNFSHCAVHHVYLWLVGMTSTSIRVKITVKRTKYGYILQIDKSHVSSEPHPLGIQVILIPTVHANHR